jgi:hypothetical protein
LAVWSSQNKGGFFERMRSRLSGIPRAFAHERHNAGQTDNKNKIERHQMKLNQLHLVILIGAAMFTSSAIAGPGPGTWPTGFPTVVKSKAEAMARCVPKEKVALVCADCKTTSQKPGEDKKGILAWFKPDSMHDCSGCGGKTTVKKAGGDKGVTYGEYSHVCTKCGKESAYTCASHKKS